MCTDINLCCCAHSETALCMCRIKHCRLSQSKLPFVCAVCGCGLCVIIAVVILFAMSTGYFNECISVIVLALISIKILMYPSIALQALQNRKEIII